MQRKEELLGSKDTAIPPKEKAIPLPIMMGNETAPISWGKCRLMMEKTPNQVLGRPLCDFVTSIFSAYGELEA